MTPPEPIKLSIYRGPIKDFEGESLYDLQVFSTDVGAVAFVNDLVTNRTIYDGLPIEYVSMWGSSVRIKVKEA